MKIDNKILSLPPYVSTTWSSVASLHMDQDVLIVTLLDADTVRIPCLPSDIVKQIFSAHADYLAKEAELMESDPSQEKVSLAFTGANPSMGLPLQFGFGNLEHLGSMMQHDMNQAQAPDIPQEILKKIAQITKIVSPDAMGGVPEAEPHCNCFHCQVARAIQTESGEVQSDTLETQVDTEKEVADEELQFCQWEVTQTADDMYVVTNRLDEQEKFTVYLGNPVGCTCGKKGCDHLLSVLKTPLS